MPTTLRYIGAEERFFETAVTGSQQMWLRGQSGPASDAHAVLLLATGKFERYERNPVFEQNDQIVTAPGDVVGGGVAGRKGAVLSYVNSTSEWTSAFGATVALDSAVTFDGQPTVAVTPTSSFDLLRKDFSQTFNLEEGTTISLVVDIPDAAVAANPSMILGFSSGTYASKNLAITFNPVYFRRAGRHVLTVRTGAESGLFDGADWVATGGETWSSNFTHARLILNNLTGIKVNVAAIFVGAKDAPTVVWTFDSVKTSTMNIVAPLFKANGWRAAVFLDGDTVAANINNLRILRDNYGWEIGTQGIGHINYTSGGNASLLAGHFDQCAEIHAQYGLDFPSLWAYPSNASNAATDATLKSKGVLWARSGGNDLLAPVGRGLPETDTMIRHGVSQPLGKNYTTMKARVDALKKTGGYLSLFTHGASSLSTDWTLDADLASFYALCDYIKDNDIRCILPGQIATDAQSRVWY